MKLNTLVNTLTPLILPLLVLIIIAIASNYTEHFYTEQFHPLFPGGPLPGPLQGSIPFHVHNVNPDLVTRLVF